MRRLPVASAAATFVAVVAFAVIVAARGPGTASNVQAVAAPPNDEFLSARVIAEAELPFGDSVDVAGATIEVGEPLDCFFLDHTVWYKFTPSTATDLRADTQGSSISAPFINVYTGAGSTSLAELSPLSCGSAVDFGVSAGTTYYFQVGDFYGQQSGMLAFNLIETGSISGTVTEEGSGIPLASVYVSVYDDACSWMNSASTDATGSYIVGDLRPGNYKVQYQDFSGNHISEWYKDKVSCNSADLVSVEAGSETSGINAALAVGGSVSGTVTDEATGAPLPDICVNVNDTSSSFFGFASTDSLGDYTVGGLPSGDFRVQFSDCSFPGPDIYIREWYNDKPDFDSADLVSVSQGVDTGGINAALAVGGSIAGTVTEEGTGTPVFGICVDVYDTSFLFVASDLTDMAGNYTVGGLPTGSYKVQFSDCIFPVTFVSESYNNKANFSSADLVAVTQGSTTSGIDATLSEGGSISGTVTEEGSGIPLASVYVSVYDAACSWMSSASTDATGSYIVGGLRTGNYEVQYQHFSGNHISEWYNDKVSCNSADPVSVSQGSTTSGVGAALAVGGSISGTVTTDGSGAPLAGICVTAYKLSGFFGSSWAGSATTDSSGQYTIGGLRSGDYVVQFYDCNPVRTYIAEWYDNQPNSSSADLVTVAQGSDTPGINAALAVGGSISGTVTEEGTTTPIPGICVQVQGASSSFAGYGFDTTDSAGNYRVGGLPSGGYRVQFYKCGSTPATHVAEWYDDKADSLSADVVSVTQGIETAGIDAALAVAGIISGTVTAEDTASPLPDVCVDVSFDVNGVSISFGGIARTDAAGNFAVGGLPSGEYRVHFRDCSDSVTYVDEWYDDKPDFNSANLVSVTQGTTTSGINSALALGGSISGAVTEEGTGTPLADICVSVNYPTFSFFGSAYTDSSGNYTVGGLRTGNYKVQFTDCRMERTHLSEWYNNKADFRSADLVSVTLGIDTPGVDAALALGGSIAGTVTEEGTGTPLEDICVNVYDESFFWMGSDRTDSSGGYSVGALATGNYALQFVECPTPAPFPGGPVALPATGGGVGCPSGAGTYYVPEWYNDKPDCLSADSVAVTQGAETGGIDAALAVGGSISGTVTEEGTGTPLRRMCVSVNEVTGISHGFAQTDSAGNYAVGGLRTGDYNVQFWDCNTGEYLGEYYNNKPDADSADLVAVAQGLETSGIDAALALGGTISGTVTEEGSGIPLSDVCVAIYDPSWSWMRSGYTDFSGNYSVVGLPTGDYKIEFRECGFPTPTHVGEWYNGQPDFFSANLASVTQGVETAGIDAALAVGGTISGTVTEEGTGTLLSGICVTVYDQSWMWARSGFTDTAGNYTVDGLATGSYRVRFDDCGFPATHVGEWYSDKGDFGSADPVAVTQGLDAAGIDAALAVGGTIAGVVLDATAQPIWGASVCPVDAGGPIGPCGYTEPDGTYTIGGLATGDYTLFADAFQFAGECYNNVADCSLATPVNVSPGLTTSGINFTLGTGGTISGTVTDGNGSPIWGASVGAASFDGCCETATTFTGPDGTYQIEGLASGDFLVAADAFGFAGEYYSDTTDPASATPIGVAAPGSTSGIDFSLDDDADDDGITDAVENATGTSPTDADTDDDGLCDGAPVMVVFFGGKGGGPGGPSVCALGFGPAEPGTPFKAVGEDTNGDGVVDAGETDPRDADSDDDGLSDGLERGLSSKLLWNTDASNPNFQLDSDPLSTTDPLDPDTDGDGLLDGVEDANHNGRVDPGETNANVPDAPEGVTEPAPAGGTVTTDTEADGATALDPVETSVTTPKAGTVSIEETSITEPTPTGFQLLGQQVNITAPAATPDDPLVIVLRIDSSRIPPGEDETTIQLFKDGVIVPACTGAPGTAVPDPCVSSRAMLGDADVEITVLTSTASAWNLGACVVTDCDADGFTNAVEGSLGTDPFLACGGQGWPPDFNGDTRVNLSDIFLFRTHFATIEGGPGYDARFDLNADGRINLADVFVLRQHFATQCVP